MLEKKISKERHILMVMRKTLAKVVVDLTPDNAFTKYPLSDDTVESMKICFDLISTRERELAIREGMIAVEKPHFTDETQTTRAVSIDQLQTKD